MDEPCYSETSLQLQLVHSSPHYMLLLQQKEVHVYREYHENRRSKHLNIQVKQLTIHCTSP